MAIIQPPNPLVALDTVFQDGSRLRFVINPPIQQMDVMADIGKLLAKWGVEFNVEPAVDSLTEQLHRAWQHGYALMLSPLLGGERDWHAPAVVAYVFGPILWHNNEPLARAEAFDGDIVKALRVTLDSLEQAGWPTGPAAEGDTQCQKSS